LPPTSTRNDVKTDDEEAADGLGEGDGVLSAADTAATPTLFAMRLTRRRHAVTLRVREEWWLIGRLLRLHPL
jgi:hypothetical protein